MVWNVIVDAFKWDWNCDAPITDMTWAAAAPDSWSKICISAAKASFIFKIINEMMKPGNWIKICSLWAKTISQNMFLEVKQQGQKYCLWQPTRWCRNIWSIVDCIGKGYCNNFISSNWKKETWKQLITKTLQNQVDNITGQYAEKILIYCYSATAKTEPVQLEKNKTHDKALATSAKITSKLKLMLLSDCLPPYIIKWLDLAKRAATTEIGSSANKYFQEMKLMAQMPRAVTNETGGAKTKGFDN